MKKYLNNSNFFEKTIKIMHKTLKTNKKSSFWHRFETILLQNV